MFTATMIGVCAALTMPVVFGLIICGYCFARVDEDEVRDFNKH